MRSQFAIVIAISAAASVAYALVPTISAASDSITAPDLSLHDVAFARIADGRVVVRGTARQLDYRREGGRVIANGVDATMVPEAGTGPASFGALHVAAPQVDGEIVSRHGRAWGGVALDTVRGDRAVTEAVAYDGATLHGESRVTAQGPGYSVEGNGLVAQADGSSVRLTSGVQGKLEMEAEP